MGDIILATVAQLIHSNDVHSKRLGELIASIKDELEDGRLTYDEFDSLMIDVEALRKTIENTHTIEFTKQIHDAVCALIELAKMAKF